MTEKMLLTETIDYTRQPVVAESSFDENLQEKFFYLKGLFLEGEVKNHNGRVYPAEEIHKAVEQLNEKIAKFGPIPGELDHPDGLNINFDRVSHVITEMQMDGSNGVGTMKVINAGLGLIVAGCIKAGMKIGVSSRGSGNIGGDGKVQDFDIVTVDIVANPSAPNAYPNVSLAESMARSQHGQEVMKLTDFVRNDASAQKYIYKEANAFIRELVTRRK